MDTINIHQLINEQYQQAISKVITEMENALNMMMVGRVVQGVASRFDGQVWVDYQYAVFTVKSVKINHNDVTGIEYIVFTSTDDVEYEFESELQVVK